MRKIDNNKQANKYNFQKVLIFKFGFEVTHWLTDSLKQDCRKDLICVRVPATIVFLILFYGMTELSAQDIPAVVFI